MASNSGSVCHPSVLEEDRVDRVKEGDIYSLLVSFFGEGRGQFSLERGPAELDGIED